MVQLKLNDEGNIVNAYEGNPEFGFVVLTSSESVFQNGWLQVKERSTILRGQTEMLKGHFTVGQQLPGRIAVTECLEDNIPAQLQIQLQKGIPFEEQIAPYLKRAGSNDAPVLVQNGKRILRFTEYDATDSVQDIRIQHDNIDAIKAFNAKADAKDAKLPS